MNNDIRVLPVTRPYPDQELTELELGNYGGISKDERLKEVFDSYKDEIRRMIVPKAAIGFGTGQNNKQLLFLVMTLGEPVLKYLDMPEINSDSYLAMVLSAMADSCLFVMERNLAPLIKSICREKGVGISGRIQDGYDNMLLACKAVDSERTVGVRADKCGYMKPVKSLFTGYVIKENSDEFIMDHDCGSCDAVNCYMRKVMRNDNSTKACSAGVDSKDCPAEVDTIVCPAGVNVREYLISRKIYISSPCAGHGICGKCRIRVVKGKLSCSVSDRAFFTDKELNEGRRLACTAFPEEEIEISIPMSACTEESMYIEGTCDTSDKREPSSNAESDESAVTGNVRSYGIAIDIGTTTLAAVLADRKTGKVMGEASCLNHQRSFGADVISRINAAVSGKEIQLCETVNIDIENLVIELADKTGVPFESIEEIMITGNAVMEHLLTGDDVSGFTKWPFRMAYSGWKTMRRRDLYKNSVLDCDVSIAPGFSAFVGSDIAAGFFECRSEGTVLFIDVGTNGEMVLERNGEYLAASTAAGPAFEGGCISCGTGSIRGAVSSVRIENGKVTTGTIQNAEPTGICGTGIIEAVAEMRTANIIDKTGKLDDRYRDKGFTLYENGRMNISITQDDIRSVQLAKAAVRAGIDTLVHRAGITVREVDKVILAGGFGCRIDPKAACGTGLLPAELSDKTISMGNTSLKGALDLLLHKENREPLAQFCKKVSVCELSVDDYFAERFIADMDFE